MGSDCMKSLILPVPSSNGTDELHTGDSDKQHRVMSSLALRPKMHFLLAASILLAATYPFSAGAEATATETARQDSKDLHVVVKPGDSLSSILRRELDSEEDWKLVARTNKIASPDNLLPGDVIVIPHSLVERRNYARLAFSKGTATLVRAITRSVEEIKKGLKIFVGDGIKTGEDGFVSLSFRDSSLVNIQPNSEIVVEKLECFDKTVPCVIGLRASQGELNMDVSGAGFDKPTQFTIETPYASAVVRGTRLDFEIRDGNVLGVTEGEVEISFAGESSIVPLGKGTLAGEGRSVTTMYDLLVAPQFPGYIDFDRVSSEDLVQWETVEDAEKYLVTFATDEAMTNVVAGVANNTAEDDATMTESTMQPGEYFVEVRGVDENGLKGFGGKKEIRQVALAKNVGPDLDIEISDQSMKIESDNDSLLEIHVGNELQFAKGRDRLLQYETHLLEPGQALELDVAGSSLWYVTAREIISQESVSVYGGIYEYRAEP